MVGTFGMTSERFLPEVPSAITWPDSTLWRSTVMASNIICTWPPSTLERMSPEVLCGT